MITANIVSVRSARLVLLLSVLLVGAAHAQLAPTGAHYAGRSSDTGHSSVSGTGGYSTAVPLDLPSARGGMPVPVALTYGGRGVGAAGVGWDVPISYVRSNASIARRRPAYSNGGPLQAREQVVVSLGGKTIQMVRRAPNEDVWLGRQDAADLELHREIDGWRLLDGSGHEFRFTQLVGDDLWLLKNIVAPRFDNTVELEYATPWHESNTSNEGGPRVKGTAIDLIEVRYNTHPNSQSCYKVKLELKYGQLASRPLSISLTGKLPIVRMRTLNEVAVLQRESCETQDNYKSLRQYQLNYLADGDTKLPRLTSVTMSGRQDLPGGEKLMPVATYGYGAATDVVENPPQGASERTLTWVQGESVALPADLGSPSSIAETIRDSLSGPPDQFATEYVQWQALLDMTGDGRPDLVYKKNDKLWLATNTPAPNSSSSLTAFASQQLSDSVFSNGPLASHTSKSVRYNYSWQNRDQVWRQAIDVNGDGRIDIIDAEEEAGHWVVYQNTPGATTNSAIAWRRVSIAIGPLKNELEANGHNIEGNFVPLSRRTTGVTAMTGECWRWNSSLGTYEWYPEGFFLHCFGTNGPFQATGPEATYTEWELKDINGDGYPDVVFNSSPVEREHAPPSPPSSPPAYFYVELDRQIRPSEGNEIRVAFNTVGVRLDTNYPFSQPVAVSSNDGYGVALWTSEFGTQSMVAGFEDVNGDGLLDRIRSFRQVDLGTGNAFDISPNRVSLLLPAPIRSHNPFLISCEGFASSFTYPSAQTGALRDVTGDHIPDLIDETRVWIGTGTEFRIAVAGGGAASTTAENCGGDFSKTKGGLYDLDADGQPEYVSIAQNPPRLEVYHLAGTIPGRPEAGRLTTISNGHGATTTIGYRSAKEDASSHHQVPFPEVVVTSVVTTGNNERILSTVRYAYGQADMFFDPALDAFTMRAYGRSVETHGAGPEEWQAGFAIVRETVPLRDPIAGDNAANFERYQIAGRPRETHFLGTNVPRDPWQLLATFVPLSDSRRLRGSTDEWQSEYVPLLTQPSSNPFDCVDVTDPYDWPASLAFNNGYSTCKARGFTYLKSSETWAGTQPPPSSASNVQTRFEVTRVDSYGNVLAVKNENDRNRSDDDVCVDVVFAAPTAQTRVLSAVATREITNCLQDAERRTLSADSFEYDELPVGSVGLGRLTSHTIKPHATDDSEPQKEIREFELGYDSVGNVNYVVTARSHDGAVRSVAIDYDEFGLAPVGSTVDATAIAPLQTSIARDRLTLESRETTDANGTTWVREYDAFGRSIRAGVQPPGGALGIVSTTLYRGFEGGDRSVETKTFHDPVPLSDVDTTAGQGTVVYLDEIGRSYRAVQTLGSDYSDKSLVLTSRVFDDLGRVTFEADPYLSTLEGTTRYGTTYHFAADGALSCSIRGHGPQPLNLSSDLQAERFPTCITRTYSNNQVHVSVNKPDSLHAGSPQAGMTYTDTMTAVGWVLQRETVRAGSPRRELSTFEHDRLGQLVAMTRYLDPASASDGVTSSFRLDSSGKTLSSREPETAERTYSYSDWGELLAVDWTDTTMSPAAPMMLSKVYDALGRMSASWETTNGAVIPETEYAWKYDVADSSPLPTVNFTAGRLTQTKSAIGDMHVSYDAFGRVEARAFTDSAAKEYFERSERNFDGALTSLEFQLPDTGYSVERIVYEYDSARRLRTVNEDTGARMPLYSADDLDPLGHLLSATFGANTKYKAHYAEGGRQLLLDEEYSLPGNHRRRIEYVDYDAVGRETQRNEYVDTTGGTTASGFDALGRLTASMSSVAPYPSTSYSYDPLGNIQSLANNTISEQIYLSYSTVDRDRLCGIDYGQLTNGLCNVTHDDSGNVVRMPTQSGNDRLLEYYPSGAIARIEQGTTTAQFRFDGSGEISELDISGAFLSDARRDRRYGLFENREVTINGKPESITVRSIPGPGGIVATRRGADGPWIFPFSDGRGTRSASNDTSFVQDVNYLPFGKASSTGAQPGTSEYSSLQWNGGDALLDLGIVHLGARLYDPAIGRFLSRDPLLFARTASTSNPYAFAFNDPINFADPSGLDPSICKNSLGSSCGDSDGASGVVAGAFAIGVGYGFVTRALGNLGGGGGDASAKTNLPAPWSRVWNEIQDNPIWDTIADGVDFYFDAQAAAVTGMRNAFYKPLRYAVTHPLQVVKTVGKAAWSAGVTPLMSVVDGLSDAYGFVSGGVSQMHQAVAGGGVLEAIAIGSEMGMTALAAADGLGSAVRSGVRPIAVGLTDTVGHAPGSIHRFAKKVNATTYWEQYSVRATSGAEIIQRMQEQFAVRPAAVNLTGLDWIQSATTAGIEAGLRELRNAGPVYPYITEAEISSLISNEVWFNTARWYYNGSEVFPRRSAIVTK